MGETSPFADESVTGISTAQNAPLLPLEGQPKDELIVIKPWLVVNASSTTPEPPFNVLYRHETTYLAPSGVHFSHLRPSPSYGISAPGNTASNAGTSTPTKAQIGSWTQMSTSQAGLEFPPYIAPWEIQSRSQTTAVSHQTTSLAHQQGRPLSAPPVYRFQGPQSLTQGSLPWTVFRQGNVDGCGTPQPGLMVTPCVQSPQLNRFKSLQYHTEPNAQLQQPNHQSLELTSTTDLHSTGYSNNSLYSILSPIPSPPTAASPLPPLPASIFALGLQASDFDPRTPYESTVVTKKAYKDLPLDLHDEYIFRTDPKLIANDNLLRLAVKYSIPGIMERVNKGRPMRIFDKGQIVWQRIDSALKVKAKKDSIDLQAMRDWLDTARTKNGIEVHRMKGKRKKGADEESDTQSTERPSPQKRVKAPKKRTRGQSQSPFQETGYGNEQDTFGPPWVNGPQSGVLV